jgi:DNA-binding LacI/PurR family transcriptional regulator
MVAAAAKRGRAVTLRDVATRAGVSMATASRALAGDSAISEPTRQRVADAATHLSYRPHAGARSLRTRTTQLIGVLVCSSGDSYSGEVVAGIELRARERDRQVLLAMSHLKAEREREAFELFLYQRVDGVIAVSPIGDDATMALPAKAGVPAVVINWDVGVPPRLVERVASGPSRGLTTSLRGLAPGRGTHVRFDDTAGALLATEHLIGLGHRRFVFLSGLPVRSSVLRLLGFRQALERAHLWPQPVLQPEPTLHGRQTAVAEFLAGAKPPVAVVAYDDITAIAVLRAAHDAGWSVPEQLSVVGIDDIELAEYTTPPLTTVAQPKVELGELAVEAVLGSARNRASDHLLGGKLLVRGTTGPAIPTPRGVARTRAPRRTVHQ